MSGVANTATLPGNLSNDQEKATVNDVVATNIAASVAAATNLSVAPSVSSLAISTQIESQLPTSDDSSISKPSIIQVSAAGRNIVSYTVADGDTTDSIAAKFRITKDTLKWANNMVSDALTVGQSIQILPRDGLIYTVKAGDSVQGIADKYKADSSVITTYNDLEISGVTPGLKIVIPNGDLPTNERPGYTAPVSVSRGGGFYAGYRAGSVGNKYAYGNCTWYAYERRAALGKPVGSFWGNGGSWSYSAAAAGYRVDNTPEAGALLVERGSPGHVAVVESVAADGSIVVSEMNNSAYGGFNIVNNRTISAGQATLYVYVH
ncbi:MAG: CHAP domain-containing protein [Candidatus Saccharimonadales bacterium]